MDKKRKDVPPATLANMQKFRAMQAEAPSKGLGRAQDLGNVEETAQSKALSNLGSMGQTQVVDAGAIIGGSLGAKEFGKEGALMGAGIGSVMSRALAEEQSGKTNVNSTYSKILKGLSNENGEPVITFEDGTSFMLPLNPDEVVPNAETNILTGKSDKKAVELDPMLPRSKSTYNKLSPIAKHIVQDVYGLKANKTNSAVVKYLAGAMTNGILNDRPDSSTINSRVSELKTKFGVL